MKKVTVIIPTYKRADSLVRAIHSVLAQNYKNIEIIIVDDNDENSTYRRENEKKLKNYILNKSIVYLTHKKNQNGAVARNTGIKQATGDYITFLDDDDYFLPNRLQKLVDLLEKNREYDCAYTAVLYRQNNKFIKKIQATSHKDVKQELLNQRNIFGTGSNLFFRKEAILKNGLFDENFVRHQDIEYMLRFFSFGKVIPLNEFLVVKCTDDKNNVPNFEKMLETKNMFFTKFHEEIEKYNEKEIYYNNYLQLFYSSLEDRKHFHYSVNLLKQYNKISGKIYLKYFYKKVFRKVPFLKQCIYFLKPSSCKRLEKKTKEYEKKLEGESFYEEMVQKNN